MDYLTGYNLLKEMGYTKEQLDFMWQSLVGKHQLITQLDKHGKTWTDLNPSAIKTLPTQFFEAGLTLPSTSDSEAVTTLENN